MSTGTRVDPEFVELLVEVDPGIDDVAGGLAGVVESGEPTAEHGCIEQSQHDCTDGSESSRIVDGDAARCVDDTSEHRPQQ